MIKNKSRMVNTSGFNEFFTEQVTQLYDELVNNFGVDVLVQDEPRKVYIERVTNTYLHGDDRYIYSSNELTLGMYVDYNDKRWIIVNYPECINNAYWRARIRMCNNVFTIQTGTIKELKGYNPYTGEPVYTETPQYSSWDCIVEQKIMNISNPNDSIILPQGRISIILPDVQCEAIKVGAKFEMWNEDYRIVGVDRTNPGLLMLLCERVV